MQVIAYNVDAEFKIKTNQMESNYCDVSLIWLSEKNSSNFVTLK